MQSKSIIFDSGPIISLSITNLLWTLAPLKETFKGEFYITPAVYEEVVKKPFYSKRYKFEALQVYPLIISSTLKIMEHQKIKKSAEELLEQANKIFKAQGNWIKIVHYAEIEAIATALFLESSAVVLDERTTRQLIEDPLLIAKHLERELHVPITVNKENLESVKAEIKNIKVLRSTELAIRAYELGFFDKLLVSGEEAALPHVKQELLEGALWALKLNGCSLKESEIDEILKLEQQKKENKSV